MTRAMSLFFGLCMLVQIIRPIGVPGLKRRVDAWKIAAVALAIFMLVAALKPS